MGYMGFGMRKEVFTRKPKTSFSKMKMIYGDHMEDFHKSKKVKNEWSEKDKEEFKKFITNKIKKHKMMEGTYNAIIYFAIASIIGLAIYFGFY
jgi:hypothetical protein